MLQEVQSVATELGEVMSTDVCTNVIRDTNWNGVAVYMLWDRANLVPVYCGTAKSVGRLVSHLKKDNPATLPTKHNLSNPELTQFWKGQKRGWLGVSFKLYPTECEAKEIERKLIAAHGIRKMGGRLFNQRLSG